ncbi:MAG: 2-oxoacid:acceptor oxidoreductase family protein [Thermodesulfobacteriota bacterium]
MSDRYEIRLCGSGGQGLILAGVILAEAAALHDGKNAVQTQSYGPESRGGFSSSVVIISDGDIDYPKATKVDVLLALTQQAANMYTGGIKDEGILIIDDEMVRDIPMGKYRVYRLPIIQIAKTQLGKVIVANIVALGAIVGITKVVSTEAIKKALFSKIPKGTERLNLSALEAGIKLAIEASNKVPPNVAYVGDKVQGLGKGSDV